MAGGSDADWYCMTIRLLGRALMVAAALAVFTGSTAAQSVPRDYAAEARRTTGAPVDGRPGYVWRHDGHGWLQEASAVLNSPPEPACFDPYDDGVEQCADGPRNANAHPAVSRFLSGHCYRGGYATFQIRVSSVGESWTAARAVVAAEWLPNVGSDMRGPLSFYGDTPPFAFTEIVCPVRP